MTPVATFVLALATLVVLPEAGAAERANHAPFRPPAFMLPGLDGRQHQLAEWKDKVVLLNFWASWCSPCQTEIRDLVAFQEQYGVDGLQIVGVGMDDETKLRNVSRTLGINYPVLLSNPSGSALMSRLGNRDGVVPYSVLISRQGEVVYTHTGTIDRETFAEQVVPLLKQGGPAGGK